MTTGFQKVIEFNKTFGFPVNKDPQRDIFVRDPESVQLKVTLIEEETEETIDAVTQNDLKEVVDGAIDSHYVIYGMGSFMGMDLDKAMRETYQVADNQTNFDRVYELCEKEHIPVYRTPQLNICRKELISLIVNLWFCCKESI